MKQISEQNNIKNNFVVKPDFKAVVAKDAPAEERRHRKEKGTEINVDILEVWGPSGARLLSGGPSGQL